MHLILLAFFLSFTFSAFSQTITGTVREKGSGLPLPFANVFVKNTAQSGVQGLGIRVDGKTLNGEAIFFQ